MVEPQIVVLVVAGSSPVGHPCLANSKIPGPNASENVRIFGGISNLTDEKYYSRVFFNGSIEPAPRLSGYAGVSVKF